MEIEIPRRLINSLLFSLLIIGPTLMGMHASPAMDDGRPLLLTPRLARLNEYRRHVHSWVEALRKADEELSKLLKEQSSDLFDQNSRVNGVYRQMQQATVAIDQTPVPPTFETLHELIGGTAKAYLDVTVLIARWNSEPSEDNKKAGQTALSSAWKLLNLLYTNPWIEMKP